jgi:hypothetical protein
LVDLLGDDYAIELDKPRHKDDTTYYTIRCFYYTHNDDHYDHEPDAWIGETADGRLFGKCFVCERKLVIYHEGWQPAPTLRTIARNDQHLIKVLDALGCVELPERGNEIDPPKVGFPVTYADGTQGFHFRVYLEGKDKWRHKEGGKASKAVFGLHRREIQYGIQKKRMVVVTESSVDAATLIAAGFPAIAVCGKDQSKALSHDLHRETLLNLLGDEGTVYVWCEPDANKFPLKVANALQRPVRVINPPDYAKDALRIWLAHGKDWEALKSIVNDLIEGATEIAPQPEPEVVKHDTTTKVKVAIPESAFKRLGEIVMQEVDWLVGDYLPIAAVTLLAGEGGAGKSALLCDLAASILKGDKWLNRFEVAQGGVILIVTEGVTEIRSRLEGYGITSNDPLIIVDLTAWDDYTPLRAAHALPEILRLAKERLGDTPIKLVGLDCLRGFGFDEKQASRQKGDRLPTVREIYTPLANFAQYEGAAVVVTHHFRKLLPEERRRLYPKRKKGKEVAPDIDINLLRNLIAGTADIVNAARHALVVVSDVEAGTGIVVPVKSNRSQLLGAPIHYDWRADAPTFLNFMDEDETVMEKAFAFFRRVLADGAKPSDEVKALAKKEGISERTLWRAKARLGVGAEKRVINGKAVWVWFLPNKPAPQPDNDPQSDGSVPNPTDNPKLGRVGRDDEKPEQNLAFSSLPNKTGLWQSWQRPDDDEVCQVCQTQNPLAETLAELKNPINTSVSEQLCQVCQTSGNVEAQPEGDLQPDSDEDLWDWFLTDPEGDRALPTATTLNEPICPFCGIELEPEPDSGLAACVGCGRLFVVKRDKGGDDNDDGGNGGIDGGKLISAPKLTSTQVQRMTARQPDGSIVLEWRGKTETVTPDALEGWQPIDAIPEISLPDIESVSIPPTVVLDLETDGLDPQRGRILACGVAFYIDSREVDAKTITYPDEAKLIAEVFNYLRDACNSSDEIILTGYNIADFDLPFLIWRAEKLQVACPFRYLKTEEGEIKRWRVAATEGTLRGDPLDYPAIVTDLPISIVDTQHLVCRWDYTAKALRNYDLKSVAAHFGVNQPDRPILTPEQILHAFRHDWETFKAYLMADLRETFALFSKLVTPYIAIAALTKLPIDQVVTRSTAWIWEQILERHYNETPTPDEKKRYEGGLVVSRKGLFYPCLKLDIASLYPTIMLAYMIHSRKDPEQFALRWLKTLTKQRLMLKAKAKAGDQNAQIMQEAMKILINSLYGFYGTGGYGFNDMTAAEKVTEIGRKVLTAMIAAVEDGGGLVVEADTDGLIFCYRNADPQSILQAVSAAIPQPFKVEMEWQEAVCFVSDDKSYIVLPKEGDPIIKGSKWRGRDKEAYLTKAIPTFVRLWALEGKDAALAFALQTLNEIRSGQGWRWVVRSHRVGKGDKFLIEAGFKVGDVATYAYRDKKKSTISRQPEEGYDCLYYARQFGKIIKEVIEAVKPEAWRELVGLEATLI